MACGFYLADFDQNLLVVVCGSPGLSMVSTSNHLTHFLPDFSDDGEK